MSEPRRFGASRDVPIAEFLYRHEAEFAAGFLRSAEIPFRLQVDDAGGADAGVTISRPAVLWVREEDAEEARALLGLDDSDAEAAVRQDPETHPAPSRSRPAGHDRTALRPLSARERLVAGLLALTLVTLASAGGESAVPWVGHWEGVALLAALVLGLAAAAGRAFGPVQAFLRALSGASR